MCFFLPTYFSQLSLSVDSVNTLCSNSVSFPTGSRLTFHTFLWERVTRKAHPHTHVHKSTLSSIIHDSQKVETTQMSINK